MHVFRTVVGEEKQLLRDFSICVLTIGKDNGFVPRTNDELYINEIFYDF